MPNWSLTCFLPRSAKVSMELIGFRELMNKSETWSAIVFRNSRCSFFTWARHLVSISEEIFGSFQRKKWQCFQSSPSLTAPSLSSSTHLYPSPYWQASLQLGFAGRRRQRGSSPSWRPASSAARHILGPWTKSFINFNKNISSNNCQCYPLTTISATFDTICNTLVSISLRLPSSFRQSGVS